MTLDSATLQLLGRATQPDMKAGGRGVINLGSSCFLSQLAQESGKSLHESTPEEARALGSIIASLAGPGPKMAQVHDHTIKVPGGYIPVRVVVPIENPRGILVYYHGGGWVLGSIDENDTLARKLAERTSCAVVLVGYRLAPEHPYPTAVDDSYTALEWVRENLTSIAQEEVPLMVAGDSAGANLAAIMAIRARDRGGPHISLQALVYPVTDANFNRESYANLENQLLLTRDTMIWFWDHYLPDPSLRAHPNASPLQTPDLSNLPPATILTAEHDVLRDEGEAYATRLQESGVPTESHRYSGQMHGFFTLLMLPGSELGFQQVVKAVKACIVKTRRTQHLISS